MWPPPEQGNGTPVSYRRPLVFTTMDLSYKRADLRPLVERCPEGTSLGTLTSIHGYMTTAIDQHPYNRDYPEGCVCWPTYNFGTVQGCSHGCLYCGQGRAGKFLSIALNLEAYMQQVVGPVIEANPWNRVFRMILGGADLITFEPEYGLFDLFTKKLAEYEERYGHFHTTSSNVAWLDDLPHKDRLVGVWSTMCETAAREIETGTGNALDRIDAARKVQDMGIPVRYKLKPIIPVKGWREEYAALLEASVKRTQPESIGFCLYIWNTYASMADTLPLDKLDGDCVAAARDSAERMAGDRRGPFPHEVRKEIYQHMIREVRRWDPDVKLYVCTESRLMWDELKDELGQDPLNYVCGCGSAAIPGGGLALSRGFRYSTYSPTPA
jgi:DNA repair photolyase